MNKIVSLDGGAVRGVEPDPTIIRLLEDALARARAGEVIAVGVAEIHRNGATQGDRAGTVPISLVGVLARLSHRIISEDT